MINLYAGSGYLGGNVNDAFIINRDRLCLSCYFCDSCFGYFAVYNLQEWEFKPFCVKLIFAFYAIALFSVVGVPAVVTFQIDFGLNLIPFIDIVNSPFAYMKNTILNIILFIPMGFFVPAVWKNYRSFKTMFFMGLAVSLGIELLQIFTFRLTDIDDLITNTAGTVLGYEISRRFSFPFSLKSVDSKGILVRYEPVLILAVTLLVSMFLKPMVSDGIWNIMI